ncbi:hypothetical protein DFJ75_1696 [Williamsia muralis]|uniref:Uncharacterized protein n=1 Tax=Williamsia marianensis TaxID=85044 RepID=A0A495K118_WILMA|nr:hypothetical protein [Williamsia muralis]RKR94891.1 hypothetical protein DFJ75_1696 [Williamsia muralis]
MKKKIPFDSTRHMQALCCVCGSLRHLNRKRVAGRHSGALAGTLSDYTPSNGYSPTGEPQTATGKLPGHWAHQQRKPAHLRSMETEYDRMVCLATCDECDERTRHAMIYPETRIDRDKLEDDMHHGRLGKPVL